MSFESPDSNNEVNQQEAETLYNSLPEGMKTGYFGLEPEGELFSNKEEAGPNALPYIIVTFADGRKISLHFTLKSESSLEEQAEKVKEASVGDQNIKDIELVWQADSK